MSPKTTAPVMQETNPELKSLSKYQNNTTKPIITNDPNSGIEWRNVVWKNVLGFIVLHLITFYAIGTSFSMKYQTILYNIVLLYASALGVTAGAHRLWTHRAYNAKWPLRLLLAFGQTLAMQNDIHEWVRDHRVHHKYVDTDADPHNSRRGFFFSHMGWLMTKKHPDVITKGKQIDMSDVERDPIVMFQKNYYMRLVGATVVIVWVLIPVVVWGEKLDYAFAASVFRYLLALHGTWLVNSAAHMWGTKPYDKNISAVENITVSMIAVGEGFHNYHHTFPWDYKAGELGNYGTNLATGFLDLCAKLGLATDLKMASKEMIQKRINRTGDGSFYVESDVWGWVDTSMSEEDRKLVQVIHKMPC